MSEELKEIFEAVEAAEAAAAESPVLVVEKIEEFRAKLSEKARTLFENPCKTAEIPGLHFVMIAKVAVWPIKPWYQEQVAKLFNELVEDGMVAAVLGDGCLKNWNDVGMPDEFGSIFVLFHSKKSAHALNREYGVSCFLEEGDDPTKVAAQHWSDLAETSLERTLREIRKMSEPVPCDENVNECEKVHLKDE